MKKLKIYGDSILKGVTYDANSGRYGLCDDHRFEALNKLGYELDNKSKMGATVQKGYSLMMRTMDSIDENTVVLLEFGGNDSDYNWQAISDNPTGSFLANTPEPLFLETYRKTAQAALSKGATVIITSLIPIDPNRYMNFISKDRNYHAILSWLGDVGMLYRWQEYYSQLVESVASSLKVQLLDLRRLFLTDHHYSEMLCEDGIHPTQAGHTRIHTAVTDYLTSL